MSCCVTGSNSLRNTVGNSPRNTHAAVSTPMPMTMVGGASCAWAAASLRGCARNVMPKAFTKHAAASAPVNASMAPPSGNISRTRLSVVPKPCSND